MPQLRNPLCVCFAVVAAVLAQPNTVLAQSASIQVEAAKLDNRRGVIWFCLWKEGQSSGFPACDKGKPLQLVAVPATAPRFTFSGLAPGTYAVSLFHDEKRNGQPEFNVLGFPTSAVGMSNNPYVGLTAPPSFEKSKFVVRASTKIVIEARRFF